MDYMEITREENFDSQYDDKVGIMDDDDDDDDDEEEADEPGSNDDDNNENNNNNDNNNNNNNDNDNQNVDIDPEEKERERFQIELEFVQSLANPNYLNYLAQRGYFKNETFLNYLKYLMYWKEPEYCKYIMYPQCLSLLEMLQHEQFLKEIVNAQCSKYIDEQLLLLWLHYKKRHDWKRIDPTKLPDNIEHLFKNDDSTNPANEQQPDEEDPFAAVRFIQNEKF